MSAARLAECARKVLCRAGGVVRPRRADKDRAVDRLGIALRIGAREERPHAVPEQDKRYALIHRTNDAVQLAQILQQHFIAAACKIAEVARVLRRVAVPEMVIAADDKPRRGQPLGKQRIVFHIVAHTVRDLHDAAHLAVRHIDIVRHIALAAARTHEIHMHFHREHLNFCLLEGIIQMRLPLTRKAAPVCMGIAHRAFYSLYSSTSCSSM